MTVANVTDCGFHNILLMRIVHEAEHLGVDNGTARIERSVLNFKCNKEIFIFFNFECKQEIFILRNGLIFQKSVKEFTHFGVEE